MKKFNLIFYLFLFILLNVSCKKSISEIESSSLYGAWVETDWNNGIQELRKSVEPDEHKYGFIIYKNGRFVEHANSGGCGTPPIVYANYEGNWKYLGSNSLHITVDSWNGTTNFDLKIISIEAHKLRIKRVY